MPHETQQLLQRNQEWVKRMNEKHPDLFVEMAKGQNPHTLWIGCADSRVPTEVKTDTLPGKIFVQRNVANMVVHTDYNLLAVTKYAVENLQVKHIVVCGHYGCGGVQAAMGNEPLGLLDNWVSHIKDVYHIHQVELDNIEDEDQRWKRFVELNVKEQVINVARLSFVQEKWKQGEFPYVHGWVFDVATGKLIDLDVTIHSAQQLDKIFRYD